MKLLLKLSLTGLLMFSVSSVFAQQKFGHLNSEELVFMMPEVNDVKTSLEKMEADYIDMLELMQVDLNTKYEEFQKNVNSYTPAVRKVKEEELQGLQARLQKYYNDGRQEIMEKQNELMAPVIERVNQAIQKVGKDNGFIIIFDKAAGATVYIDESNPSMVDAAPLVKKELGIKE